MKNTSTSQEVGKLAEKIAQQSLWRKNYRVRDVSYVSGLNYDLLVNDKYKVEVKSMRGNTTRFKLSPDKFDILCVVYLHELGNKVFFLKDKKSLDGLLEGPYLRLDFDILKEFFTRKPDVVMV